MKKPTPTQIQAVESSTAEFKKKKKISKNQPYIKSTVGRWRCCKAALDSL